MECNPQMNLVIQDGETPNKRVESSLSSKKKGGQPTSEVIWEAWVILVNSGQTNVMMEYYQRTLATPPQWSWCHGT